MTWILTDETITAVANQKYLVDTSGGEFNIVLPEPEVGDSVVLADIGDNTANNAHVVTTVVTTVEFPFEDGSITFPIEVAKSQYEFIFDGTNWVIYNLSRQGVKVSDLPEQLSLQISNDDLIPYVNKSGGSYESTAIPFITLKENINIGTFTSAEDIIAALNASPSIADLNVLKFNGNTSAFYRNYNNLTNKPNIPVIVTGLIDARNLISDLTAFTSDDLAQGTVNKYLNETNFNTYFEPAFAEAYKLFSGDFPEETVIDSSDNIAATKFTSLNATSFVNITDPLDMSRFFPGKTIRIYGASVVPEVSIPTPATPTVEKRGFAGVSSGIDMRYKVIQFNFLTGEYSPTSADANTAMVEDVSLADFGVDDNIAVSFARSSIEYGILIYRSIGSSDFSLIDVLGPNQLGAGTIGQYIDYGSFNFVPWSKKNVTAGNTYDFSTGTLHFPTSVTTKSLSSRGWADVSVISIIDGANRIQIDESLYFDETLVISENDTTQIQNAINQRTNVGINSLVLNDRKYIVSKLDVPSNFSLFGRSQNTVLRKISWDSGSTNSMIYATGAIPSGIVLSNFTIDGNMQNQWFKSESSNPYANYAIDLKTESISNTIDRVRISNIIGGGIAASGASKFLIDRSRVEDSGMSDLFDYSPLIADDGNEVVITNNIFKNFSAAIDISLTDNGVFTPNIVENVGSGIIIYGSKFLISAPNIIRGPAGEFIPGPDVLNSVYDSVNIKLDQNATFTSDVYGYQENGTNFDLTSNRASLSYSMDKLRLVDNVEELYGSVLMAGGRKPMESVYHISVNPAQGQFKFSITSADVNTILSDFSLSTLRETANNHIGLVYSASLTEYVPSGDIVIDSPVILPAPFRYKVTVTDFKNLSVGTKVRMLNLGGTPNLDEEIGTVTDIYPPLTTIPFPSEIDVTIEYDNGIIDVNTVVGTVVTTSQITVENTFILAKGRVL
jgi:hypothetical protein